jgi:ketosteroid isomerase-like protein
MKKELLLIAFLIPCLAPGYGQGNARLRTMVEAERAFAKMAKEQNRRDAFLFYLADDVVTAGPEGPVRGKESIKKQSVKPDWLSWDVADAGIAAAGDMGYTTGPWEYYRNKTDEKPIAFGNFNPIWKVQPDGHWKNILDIGTQYDSAGRTTFVPFIVTPAKGHSAPAIHPDLIGAEKEFIAHYEKNAAEAYATFLSRDARICHGGFPALVTPDTRQKYIRKNLPVTTFRFVDGESASSRDIGYTYGAAEVHTTEGGKPEVKKGTYARFWKTENGKWRIAVDILTY